MYLDVTNEVLTYAREQGVHKPWSVIYVSEELGVCPATLMGRMVEDMREHCTITQIEADALVAGLQEHLDAPLTEFLHTCDFLYPELVGLTWVEAYASRPLKEFLIEWQVRKVKETD